MGKDIRGIERGKLACGECEDFMMSGGATCGYCGCLPTRHTRKLLIIIIQGEIACKYKSMG